MIWRRTDEKPLSEPVMAYFTDTYMRYLASVSLMIVGANHSWCEAQND